MLELELLLVMLLARPQPAGPLVEGLPLRTYCYLENHVPKLLFVPISSWYVHH